MKNQNLELEKRLLEEAKINKSKFDGIYKYFLNDVYRFTCSIVGNQHDAEDITSQTFIEFYKRLSTYKWQGTSMKYWLFKTARNLSYKSYSRSSRSDTLDDNEDYFDEYEISFVDQIMNLELVEEVKKEIQELKPLSRELINLRIWEGLNFKEIAEVLNSTESAVKKKFYRSIEKVKFGLNQKGIKFFVSLPLLFTAVKQVGFSPAYAASSSMMNKNFSDLLKKKKLISLNDSSSLLSPKGLIAISLGLIMLASTIGGTYYYKTAKKTVESEAAKKDLRSITQENSELEARWNTYTSEEDKFTINFPLRNGYHDAGKGIIFGSMPEGFNPNSEPNSFSIYFTVTDKNENLVSAAKQISSTKKWGYFDVSIISEDEFLIDNYAANSVTYKADRVYKTVSVFTETKSYTFNVFKEDESITFDNMLSTVDFHNNGLRNKDSAKVFKYPGIKGESGSVPGYSINYPLNWNYTNGPLEHCGEMFQKFKDNNDIRIEICAEFDENIIPEVINSENKNSSNEYKVVKKFKVDNRDAFLVTHESDFSSNQLNDIYRTETVYIQYDLDLKEDPGRKSFSYTIQLQIFHYDKNKDYSEYNDVFDIIIESFKSLEGYAIDEYIEEERRYQN